MPMNDNMNYSANGSPISASYVGINAHDSATCITDNPSRSNVNSTLVLVIVLVASFNSSRIEDNSTNCMNVIDFHWAEFKFLKINRINEESDLARNPPGSSKWRVPAYHMASFTVDHWWYAIWFHF
jgi:hypothetical protein